MVFIRFLVFLLNSATFNFFSGVQIWYNIKMELENSKTEAEKREERMQKANELCLIAVFAMFGVLMRQGIGKGENISYIRIRGRAQIEILCRIWNSRTNIFFRSHQSKSSDGIMSNFGFVENLNESWKLEKFMKRHFLIFYKTKIARNTIKRFAGMRLLKNILNRKIWYPVEKFDLRTTRGFRDLLVHWSRIFHTIQPSGKII